MVLVSTAPDATDARSNRAAIEVWVDFVKVTVRRLPEPLLPGKTTIEKFQVRLSSLFSRAKGIIAPLFHPLDYSFL